MDITQVSNWIKSSGVARGIKAPQLKRLATEIVQYQEVQQLLYEVLGQFESGLSADQIVSDLKNGRLKWDSSAYKEQQNNRQIRDNMLANPPEVREGEIACPKCKQKKTLVVEMQTRSADEGFTYWIHCLNPDCKAITK
jgi:DNA-directed RNA polymerase subunit M/transcription elongation factor TFIIS